MKIEYLLFNILILLSLIISKIFYPKIIFPKIKPLLLSIIISGLIFIIFDYFATGLFWNFNNQYILGIKFFRLPVEEILFFITVPLACLILWLNFKLLIKNPIPKFCINCILNLILLLFAGYFLYEKLYYSFSITLVMMAVIGLDKLLQVNLFRQKAFLIFINIINLFTFGFNFYLTARPVVIYSQLYRTNINILTIPIEDFIFGMTVISLNIVIYEYYLKSNLLTS